MHKGKSNADSDDEYWGDFNNPFWREVSVLTDEQLSSPSKSKSTSRVKYRTKNAVASISFDQGIATENDSSAGGSAIMRPPELSSKESVPHLLNAAQREWVPNGIKQSKSIVSFSPHLYPETPVKNQKKAAEGSMSLNQTSVTRKILSEMRMESPLPSLDPRKKLFNEPHAKRQKTSNPTIYVDSDDGDEDEVTTMLMDTGGVLLSQTSIDSSTSRSWCNPVATASSSSTILLTNIGGSSSNQSSTNSSFDSLQSISTAATSMYSTGDMPPLLTLPSAILASQSAPVAVSQFRIRSSSLQQFIIAHCSETQPLIEQYQLAWGVQYELARGVTMGVWTWADIRFKLAKLVGNNAQVASQVRSILLGLTSSSYADLSIWKELDREQKAIIENQSRGLGLMGAWEDDLDWHGGQIQQIMRLVKENGTFKVQLEPLEKRRSYRFARYCGSRRLLQLRIPDEFLQKEREKIDEFLKQKFVLLGRVFVPFYARDTSVYMVEINEDRDRTPQSWCGDQFRQCFESFINWHNPKEYNWDQALSKYVTRFALGLSNSVPALEFSTENIIFIADTYAEGWREGKAPAEKIMTDGCGFINMAALKIITKKFGYASLPAAAQGRIGGAKGLWILHPHDSDPQPRIWIRDSQRKINLGPNPHKAHRIFELLCVSQPPSTVALSQQSIVNLSYNGVPSSLLVSLLEKGLEEEIAPLADWSRPNAMVHLWDAVNRAGNVSGSRAQRFAGSSGRALGLEARQWKEETVEAEPEPQATTLDEAPVYSGRNEYSGVPFQLHECTMELIQAGFHPATFSFLRDKLKYILDTAIKASIEKYRIPLPESLSAFIVPDPLGVLEEGQIYYCSSMAMKDPETEILYNTMIGEVVLGRYPIRLPSDMQKVHAVDIPELAKWKDVIILSTKGRQSLASLLSGGDTDGDDVFLLKIKSIVEPFINRAFVPPPENLLKENFERDVESFKDFCQRATTMTSEEVQSIFQASLLQNLTDSKVGLYSTFHDKAIQRCGYAHPQTVRLAYMFTTLLDSSKSGLRLKPGVFEEDKKASNLHVQTSSQFILNELMAAGDAKGKVLIEKFNDLKFNDLPDVDLKGPYTLANDHATLVFSLTKYTGFTDEMAIIREHVDRSKDMWSRACSKSREKAQASPTKKRQFSRAKSTNNVVTGSATREFSKDIIGIKLIPNVEEIKASFAYHLNPRFAFDVAFRQLCLIKARTSAEGISPSTRQFDEAKSISSSFRKALSKYETGGNL